MRSWGTHSGVPAGSWRGSALALHVGSAWGRCGLSRCVLGPLLQLTAHLPLRAKCVSLIHQTFQRSGANMDMEFVLYRMFQEAGLPAPSMRIEVPVGDGPEIARWVYDLFFSLHPRMQQHDLPSGAFGDLDSLLPRLEAELAGTKTFAACIGLVGARSGKPGSAQSVGDTRR